MDTKAVTVREIEYGTEAYNQLVQLRFDVLRAPLGLTFSEAFLARDKSNLLVAAFAGEAMAGCCLLEPLGKDAYQLRQMAVAPEHQGSGTGRKIVQFAEELVRSKGGNRIELHAREVARIFYLKSGYTVEGDVFEEVGIPHFMMVKNL